MRLRDAILEECKKDMESLNVKPATANPMATQEIGGMIQMIGELIEKGHAYEKNGTVYFRTRSLRTNGSVSHKNLDDLKSGGRELLVSGRMKRKIRWISFFGSRRKKANRPGLHHGETAVRLAY